MEELGVPLEDDEEDDYDRTFTDYEDYMNHHNALRAQKDSNQITLPKMAPLNFSTNSILPPKLLRLLATPKIPRTLSS